MASAADLDPTVDFIAGTISGITGLIVGFPFDTVKVRFQNPETVSRYRSTLHALARIIRDERFVGLYKGITSPLATVAIVNGLAFASYRFFMKIQLDDINDLPTLVQILFAGIGTGVVTSIVTTPSELIKIRQQNCLEPTSARSVASEIYEKAGVRGLYRGMIATVLRDTSYGPYFFTYEAICRFFSPTNPGSSAPSLLVSLLAGAIAGIIGWLSTFPFDVVKTRVQSADKHTSPALSIPTTIPDTTTTSSNSSSSSTSLLDPKTTNGAGARHDAMNPHRYRTTWSTIVHSYRSEGFGVFFHGLVPTLIRSVPVNMMIFVTFEAVARALS